MAKEKVKLFSVTKDQLKIETFSGQGPGGQNRNKSKVCIRMKHPESGATGVGQSQRSLKANERDAFIALTKTEKFQTWLRLEISRVTGKLAEEEAELQRRVDEAMKPENLKIEYLGGCENAEQ